MASTKNRRPGSGACACLPAALRTEACVKGGQANGSTDELGARALERKVRGHDLHHTMLALPGFDNTDAVGKHPRRPWNISMN